MKIEKKDINIKPAFQPYTLTFTITTPAEEKALSILQDAHVRPALEKVYGVEIDRELFPFAKVGIQDGFRDALFESMKKSGYK